MAACGISVCCWTRGSHVDNRGPLLRIRSYDKGAAGVAALAAAAALNYRSVAAGSFFMDETGNWGDELFNAIEFVKPPCSKFLLFNDTIDRFERAMPLGQWCTLCVATRVQMPS